MARHFVATSSQYLESSSPPITAYPFTVSAWFKLATNIDGTVWSLADNTSSQNYWVAWYDGAATKIYFQCRSIAGIHSAIPNVLLSTGVWYHFCCVGASATDRRAFLNGANKATETTSNTPNASNRFGVGRRSRSTPDEYFDGDIAELTVWNVALSDGEAEALGRGAFSKRVRGSSVVAYAPLYGRSSPETDMTPAGPDLTVTGATQATSHPPIHPIFFDSYRIPVVAAAPAISNQGLSLLGVG